MFTPCCLTPFENKLLRELPSPSCTSVSDLKSRLQGVTEKYLNNGKPDEYCRNSILSFQQSLKEKSVCEVVQQLQSGHYQTDNLFARSVFAFLQDNYSEELWKEEVACLPSLLKEEFSWCAVNRDEVLRLLISIEKQKNQTFDCAVVEYSEIGEWLDSKGARMDTNAEYRFQGIIRNEVHYTAVDFCFQEDSVLCCVMDASKDPKHEAYVREFQCRGFKIYVAGVNEDDKIQFDTRSCGIFSFDHLVQTSRDDSFFDKLKAFIAVAPGDAASIPWSCLEPALVKNVQDVAFIKKYLEKHPNEEFATSIFKKIDLSRLPTEQNTSIEKKLQRYAEKTYSFLQKHTLEEAAAIAYAHFSQNN